jgi:PPIC-type PPIASE domain
MTDRNPGPNWLSRSPAWVWAIPLLIAVVMVVVAGCGSSQGGMVASVEGKQITFGEFQHLYDVEVAGGTTHGRGCVGSQCVVPYPYGKCVPALRKRYLVRFSTKQLLEACTHGHKVFIDQAIETLIQERWVALAAKQAGIALDSSAIQAAADEALLTDAENYERTQRGEREGLSGEGARTHSPRSKTEASTIDRSAERYLSRTGLTMEDLKAQARTRLLLEKLRENRERAGQRTPGQSKTPITQREILDYYHTHVSQLAVPQTRDAETIEVKTLQFAHKIATELRRGDTFTALRKHSNDNISDGGTLMKMRPSDGTGDSALFATVFSATPGRVVGPVKGAHDRGYWIVRVLRIHKGHINPLAAVTATIRQEISSERQKRAERLKESAASHNAKLWSTYERALVTRLVTKTTCAKGFLVALCENSPEHAEATTAGL